MAGEKEITSTEKLLDVIRGKQTDIGPAAEENVVRPSKKQKTPKNVAAWPKIFAEKRIYTIGVHIGQSALHLAKTMQSADGRPIFVEHKIVKYPNKNIKESQEFKNFLKSALVSFCDDPAKCHIWTFIPSSDVNLSHIKIPRVAKKQLENIIYWTAKKESPFDEKDFIFDFEMQGEIIDQGIPKYSVMVYSAPNAEVDKVKNLFSDMEIKLAGITTIPFALQNLVRKRWITVDEGAMTSLFIGSDFSRIDIFDKENLILTREIKTGITSMMESIIDILEERSKGIKLGKEEAKKILMSVNSESEKLTETDRGFELSEKEIYDLILPALERLARQVERTLEYYTAAKQLGKVDKIYISAEMNICTPIIDYLSEQLGIKMESLDPFVRQAGYPSIAALGADERMLLAPVLGLSFSGKLQTPNLIFTYRQKNREIYVKRLNRGIFAAFAAGLVICVSTLAYQGVEARSLNDKKIVLQKEVARYNPLLNADQIEKMAAQVVAKRQITKKYAERYAYLAVIGEIADLTPVNISLTSLKVAPTGALKDKAQKAPKDINENILIEGLVFGERGLVDSLLTQYVMKLEYSPLLRQVAVIKSSVVRFKKNDVLQFTVSAKIG